MDNLNKQQIILIALLVAIVTSITTGIVTISLSEKSPTGASQTIYKVVQQTIEKVTPEDSPVRQIVVDEPKKTSDELTISEIVNLGQKKLIKIYLNEETSEKKLISIGVPIGTKGTILSATPLEVVSKDLPLTAVMSDGTKIRVISSVAPVQGFSLYTVKDPVDAAKIGESVVLNNFTSVSLGSNVVIVGLKGESTVVSTGIISEFSKIPGTDKVATDSLAITDITIGTDYSGWMMFNTFGKLIGILYPSQADRIARYVEASKVADITGFSF